MIYLIDQAIRSKITALNFVERYGGYAVPVTSDFGTEEEGSRMKTYPVSCSLSSAECFEQDKYKNLLPNDQYKSVCYLEEISTGALELEGPKGNIWRTQVRLRVVCWLNYLKLGLDDCKSTDRFVLALIDAIIDGRDGDVFTIDDIKGLVRIQRAIPIEKNPRTVFGKYSYADMAHLYFWPYDFFAVDFICDLAIAGGCIPSLSLGSEIECLTNW